MSKEAIKLALEALEQIARITGARWALENSYAGHLEAITALREALAEQPAQQEPVAWRVKVETKLRDGSVDFGYQLRNERLSKYDEPLYTSPPQRTWVGLTDDEIYSVLENLQVMHHRPPTTDSRVIFALAVEAKLKEKNT